MELFRYKCVTPQLHQLSLNISKKKAYTSVMFNVKGSQLEGRAKGPLPTLGEGLAFMAGSTPIAAGGKMYGAVGM